MYDHYKRYSEFFQIQQKMPDIDAALNITPSQKYQMCLECLLLQLFFILNLPPTNQVFHNLSKYSEEKINWGQIQWSWQSCDRPTMTRPAFRKYSLQMYSYLSAEMRKRSVALKLNVQMNNHRNIIQYVWQNLLQERKLNATIKSFWENVRTK